MNNAVLWISIFLGIGSVLTLIFAFRKVVKDKKEFANLALFPEQNPNPVIEVRLTGEVSYMNPAAKRLFPELQVSGFEHHLLAEISTRLDEFRNGSLKMYACELVVDEHIYEQKVYAIPESNILRVYSSDITKQKETEARLGNLALFPEQNPNPVIELKLDGTVSYLNPAAKNRFPDMQQKGISHPLFANIFTKIDSFRKKELQNFNCEITVNEAIYEQKVFALAESNLLRVYSSDITNQKEIEKRLANLALFPEQNPNPVIELRLNGTVSYLNPAARKRFPDMQEKGSSHGLFDIIRPQFESFQKGELSSYLCEITIGEEVYEQKVYAIPESKILRVYSSDITERKRTEKIIRQKNEDITDSINYAKRIQRSMLPREEEISEILRDHFVLYMPKDIVSGDFYWVTSVQLTPQGKEIVKDERLAIVAAVDCTGHGVPGALMSIIGNTLLNQTIKNPNINSPAEALDFLNQELPKNLKANKGEVIRDGMDMTMCAIDFKTRTVHFSGANNPIFLLRDGVMSELKADKQPVSGSTDEEKKPFTNHVLKLKKGDIIYMFTDGYADQFGGPKGKKFKYRPFQELLLRNSSLPMEKQRTELERIILEWRGELEQVDDVLVIGIRL